jgi:hypothetical protein
VPLTLRRVEEEKKTGFLPLRMRRPVVESVFVRLIATGGIIGVGTAVAAILGSQEVAAWIIGIVVSTIAVVLAAILWSSRTL